MYGRMGVKIVALFCLRHYPPPILHFVGEERFSGFICHPDVYLNCLEKSK